MLCVAFCMKCKMRQILLACGHIKDSDFTGKKQGVALRTSALGAEPDPPARSGQPAKSCLTHYRVPRFSIQPYAHDIDDLTEYGE